MVQATGAGFPATRGPSLGGLDSSNQFFEQGFAALGLSAFAQGFFAQGFFALGFSSAMAVLASSSTTASTAA